MAQNEPSEAPQHEQMDLERVMHLKELQAVQRQIKALRGHAWKVDPATLSGSELMAVLDYERQRLRMLRTSMGLGRLTNPECYGQ